MGAVKQEAELPGSFAVVFSDNLGRQSERESLPFPYQWWKGILLRHLGEYNSILLFPYYAVFSLVFGLKALSSSS